MFSLCICGARFEAAAAARASVLVPLHVQRQVVGAREAAAAHGALERLGPRVLPVVARQLVRAREPPVAARPAALVRLLTCDRERREVRCPASKTTAQRPPGPEFC